MVTTVGALKLILHERCQIPKKLISENEGAGAVKFVTPPINTAPRKSNKLRSVNDNDIL